MVREGGEWGRRTGYSRVEEGESAKGQVGRGSEGVKRESHRQVKIGLRSMGMEEISLSGEGPGSAGPLYYSDMSPLKAVKLMTRGELREETGRDQEDVDGEDGGGWTEKPSKAKGAQSGKMPLVC